MVISRLSLRMYVAVFSKHESKCHMMLKPLPLCMGSSVFMPYSYASHQNKNSETKNSLWNVSFGINVHTVQYQYYYTVSKGLFFPLKDLAI